MEIIKLTLGMFGEHTYIVTEGGFCCVIDPEKSGGRIAEVLTAKGLSPEAILLTHTHFDHLGGVPELCASIPVYAHREEARFVAGLNDDTGMPFQKTWTISNPVVALEDGDTVGPFRLIHTPGHSPGSSLYVADSHVFSGDSMFVRGVPNLGFVHSDSAAYARFSIPRMLTLDPDAALHAGHGTEGRVLYGIPPVGAF